MLVGKGEGLTGACSCTNPVARGEEWPPFPLGVLSSPAGWRACLFVFQWYQETFKQSSQTRAQCARAKLTVEEWGQSFDNLAFPFLSFPSLPSPTPHLNSASLKMHSEQGIWFWARKRRCQTSVMSGDVCDSVCHAESSESALRVRLLTAGCYKAAVAYTEPQSFSLSLSLLPLRLMLLTCCFLEGKQYPFLGPPPSHPSTTQKWLRSTRKCSRGSTEVIEHLSKLHHVRNVRVGPAWPAKPPPALVPLKAP